MKEKQDRAAQEKSNVVSPLRQKKTPAAEDLTGIRIRGIPELKEKYPRMRQEHDLSEVQKTLAHLDVETESGDIVRLSKYEENKEEPNCWKCWLSGSDGLSYHQRENWKHLNILSFQVDNYPTK